MTSTHDLLVIGGGLNGLVTAAYLARAGRRVLILEQRRVAGGCLVTGEFHPGFRCPMLSHAPGPLRPEIVRDLKLERHGYRPMLDTGVCVLSPDGPPLLLSGDATESAAAIARRSARDAERFPAFVELASRLAATLEPLLVKPPPSLDEPAPSDLWALLQTGRRYRALQRPDGYRLLQWLPMPVADLVEEWFEDERLRAVLAARALHGRAAGPKSPGTSAGLLLQTALEGRVLASGVFGEGGPGGVTAVLGSAAASFGATLRTGARVRRVLVKDGRVSGVVLQNGEEIGASQVVSAVDPRQTFLSLLDPGDLDPSFLEHLRHYRSQGVVAKVNLALDALPAFPHVEVPANGTAPPALRARLLVAPSLEYIERAFDASKYGRPSEHPVLDVTIPTLSDPSLAPEGRHVMSIVVQYAPFALREGGWSERATELGDSVVQALAAYAPGLRDRLIAGQVITPADLETEYGLTGGHIFHGEHAFDQLFLMRPSMAAARYRTPIEGLYLCGSGTHPGGGGTGVNGLVASREILRHLR